MPSTPPASPESKPSSANPARPPSPVSPPGRTLGDPRRSYWQDNLRLVGFCLVIWFVVSFGFGILAQDLLNQIEIGGFRLGFWFAQQGSIYVFVALIFFYATRIAAIDRAHGVEEED